MKREIDKLEDNKRYEATGYMAFFCNRGDILTGKQIKDNIPFDVSPHQGVEVFFKEV